VYTSLGRRIHHRIHSRQRHATAVIHHPQSGALTVYIHIGSSIKSRDQKAREVLPNDKRINLHVFSVDFRQNGRLLLHQLVRPKPALQLRDYGVVLSAIAADLRLVD
jgi:hypothetical protein